MACSSRLSRISRPVDEQKDRVSVELLILRLRDEPGQPKGVGSRLLVPPRRRPRRRAGVGGADRSRSREIQGPTSSSRIWLPKTWYTRSREVSTGAE